MSLGYRASDIFEELSMGEVLSIVVGAAPGSAVRFALDEGWSREAHLLANMQESNAGIAALHEPYSRPGIDSRPPDPKKGMDVLHGQAMTWEEMDAADAKRAEAAASGKAASGNTRRTVW
jgi:hypothetical protein